jgi:hypothetical protein
LELSHEHTIIAVAPQHDKRDDIDHDKKDLTSSDGVGVVCCTLNRYCGARLAKLRPDHTIQFGQGRQQYLLQQQQQQQQQQQGQASSNA